MQYWENMWTFQSGRFCIAFDVTPCEDNPADMFCDSRDVQAVRDGDVYWFDARVRVLWDHNVIGQDHLGACAYENIRRDFVQSHWRNKQGDYFTDMVRAAVRDARGTIAKFKGLDRIRMRA